MPVYKAEAVVLRRRPLGEADRIITFFMRDQGKRAAVARGVRKTASRMAGRLEPFVHLRLLLAKGRGSLDVVAQVEVIDGMTVLREDLHRYGQAALAVELLEAAVPDHEPNAEVFDLLLDALRLTAEADPESAGVWFALHLMSLAGFEPVLEHCAVCGAPIGGRPAWSHPLGGITCARCASRDPAAVPLRPATVATLQTMLAAGAGDMQRVILSSPQRERLPDLLRRYAEHRLEVQLRAPNVVAHLR